MSRRHRADKREIQPDPKFGNVVVTKFMNSVMHAGKKSAAETIVYGALDIIEGKTRTSPVTVLQQALDTACRRSKCARAASAAPPTRCRSKCAPRGARRSASAGSSRRRASATKKQ